MSAIIVSYFLLSTVVSAEVTTGIVSPIVPSGAGSNTLAGTTTVFYSYYSPSSVDYSRSGSGTVYWQALCTTSVPTSVRLAWTTTDQCIAGVHLTASTPFAPSGSGEGYGKVNTWSVDTFTIFQAYKTTTDVPLNQGPFSTRYRGTSMYPNWILVPGSGHTAVVPLGNQVIAASVDYVAPANPGTFDFARGYGAEALAIN